MEKINDENQIISDYMRKLAEKSHQAVLLKYGKEFYSKIAKRKRGKRKIKAV